MAAEGRSCKLLAKRIREDADEAAALDGEIAALLADDATYQCLTTVPGIGTRTASELVIGIDIALFDGHDKLASYCGLAPKDRQSGTSISSVTASRQGNKRLKNLLIFSCNSIIRSDNRFGRYYRMLREERHMPHSKALKAVARKRLKGDIRDNAGQGPVRGLADRHKQRSSQNPPDGRGGAARSTTHGNI